VNILHVVQAYYPFQEQGGPVVKVRALASNAALHGHRVTVLTADLGLANKPDAAKRLEKCAWGSRLMQDGVEAIYLPTIAKYRALTVNTHAIDFCRHRLDQFEIVHFYGLYDLLGPTVSYFCRLRGIRYVVEPMGMYRPIDRSLFSKRLWHRVLGRRFLRGSHRLVATSEAEQAEFLAAGVPSGKVVVRYNGIDKNLSLTPATRGAFRTKWNIPHGEPLIFFLSRLIPRKGADVLIEAFAQACPEKGRLVIAGPEGEPKYGAYLRKCAHASSAEARIVFTGPLYDEEKKAALEDTDIFALPSRYENFANVAAEAIACQIPVIISDACGISSLVNGIAGLVIPPTRADLAQAIRSLLSDNDLYDRLKQGCPTVAAQLDWSFLSAQMENCYAEVLAENGARSGKLA
jgi:glycosyltransferase involved in cell wall biosynthesis